MNKELSPQEEGEQLSSTKSAQAPTENSERPAASHCPYQQATLFQQALAPDKMRIAFFLGAGCPVSIRIPENEGTRALIPDIAGLTEAVCSSLSSDPKYRTNLEAIILRLREKGATSLNIEAVLSHIRALHEVVGKSGIDGLTEDSLAELDAEICRLTTKVVQVQLPNRSTPYHSLATWIKGVQRAHPVEIFTPNYDLLIEQALEEGQVPYFDGFVGSYKTFFDLASIEQDTLPPRWARLWKVHGSINWWRTPDGDIQRRESADKADLQMIYPSHMKYDQSRRLPYLAMLDRLKTFLARDQAVLVTCGYSFLDQHLNETIFQGLSGNATAVCFAFLHGKLAKHPEAITGARTYPNLRLLAIDGAILGTVERNWNAAPKPEHPLHDLAVVSGDTAAGEGAHEAPCEMILGDFLALGHFLACQLAYRLGDEGENNAS